ncbi:MAG TPA: hypothetical protein VFJ43_00265, partial [Bacteroidia bacterium]|nr:hypothetical protein [Bacteroidia bacterium]
IHFISKPKKRFLDFLKLIWLLLVCYLMLSVIFPIVAFETIKIFLATIFLFPVLMGFGFYKYFRKSKTEIS